MKSLFDTQIRGKRKSKLARIAAYIVFLQVHLNPHMSEGTSKMLIFQDAASYVSAALFSRVVESEEFF